MNRPTPDDLALARVHATPDGAKALPLLSPKDQSMIRAAIARCRQFWSTAHKGERI